MLAYLMLFAALFNSVCLSNAYFIYFYFCKCFFFHTLSWVIDAVFLFQILFCIMHSAFNLLVFVLLCSHIFYNERTMCSGEIALKNNHSFLNHALLLPCIIINSAEYLFPGRLSKNNNIQCSQ